MLKLDGLQLLSELVQTKDLCLSREGVCWVDPGGALTISTVNTDDGCHYRLRMGRSIIVDVLPDGRVINRSSPQVPQSTMDHFLADQVAPRVIAESGRLVLHAGAICLAEEAILIAGISGRGKSTLSASFVKAGFALMGDDAIVITVDEGPWARAVYPSLRLFPDSLAVLLPHCHSTEVAHYSPKQRIEVPVATANSTPLPIRAIYVLAEPEEVIRLNRLSIAETCIALVESSFALNPSDTSRARMRLSQCSALARDVPAFELAYPRDYARLDDIRMAIIEHARGAAR